MRMHYQMRTHYRMKLVLSLLCLLPLVAKAGYPIYEQWFDEVAAIGGEPYVEYMDSVYKKIKLADSCYVEVYNYGDSVLLVQTVCAPLCSSVAQIYDSQWKLRHTVSAPENYTLPQAFIEQGILRWEENYKDEND